MDDATGGLSVVAGAFVLLLGGRIAVHVLRRQIARFHAIQSIPLPRQPALVSGKPATQFEAVFFDVFDTEHRRSVGEPNYATYSAEEIAELRTFLFDRALRRREPRILLEIELGVPILRKLEERDSEVCAWFEERLKAHPPLFGKPHTIDSLILNPWRFRGAFWDLCIGSSPVLFFEQIFRSLPITVLPRGLLPSGDRAAGGSEPIAESSLPPKAPAGEDDQRTKKLVASLDSEVRKTLEGGDEAEARAAISEARDAIQKASPEPRPTVVREFLDQLAGYEERLATFEDAFGIETSKHMDDWAPWIREALVDANGGANLTDLGEDAVLDVFKRRARYRWVTDSTATASSDCTSPGDAREGARSEDDDNEESPIIDTTGEATADAPSSLAKSSDHDADKGTKLGF